MKKYTLESLNLIGKIDGTTTIPVSFKEGIPNLLLFVHVYGKWMQ